MQRSFRGRDLDLNYAGCAEDGRGLKHGSSGYARVRYCAKRARMRVEAGCVAMYVDHVNDADKQHQHDAHARQCCMSSLPAGMDAYC